MWDFTLVISCQGKRLLPGWGEASVASPSREVPALFREGQVTSTDPEGPRRL